MQPSYLAHCCFRCYCCCCFWFVWLVGWLVGCCCFGGCLFCCRFCLFFVVVVWSFLWLFFVLFCLWGAGGGGGWFWSLVGGGGSCCFNLWCILVLFVAGFGTARLARGERRTVLVPGQLLQVCDPMQPRPVCNRNSYPERTRTCSSTLPQLPPPAPPHARQVVWCVDYRQPVDTHRCKPVSMPVCLLAEMWKLRLSLSLGVFLSKWIIPTDLFKWGLRWGEAKEKNNAGVPGGCLL